MSDSHDLAHELRDVIAIAISDYVAFQEEQGIAVGPVIQLLALEMEASVTRRVCRDAGLSKGQIRNLQTSASSCGKIVYEELKMGPEEQEYSIDDSADPLDN